MLDWTLFRWWWWWWLNMELLLGLLTGTWGVRGRAQGPTIAVRVSVALLLWSCRVVESRRGACDAGVLQLLLLLVVVELEVL